MRKWLLVGGVGILVSAAGVVGAISLLREEKTEITTAIISARGSEGRVIEGENKSNQSTRLKTDKSLLFESAEIKINKPKVNAAILEWGQTDGRGEVHLEFRTNNGQQWSDWVRANDPGTEKPDHTASTHKAMILADEIHKIQYRFEISGKDGQISPAVDVNNAQIELIDSTKGPSPTKKNFLEELLEKVGLIKRMNARADGPRIYSRAEWGSPEPNSSERWAPEYRSLNRIVVHHTASTMTSDPAAMIRAIWHFHANGNDWGDIGYNYLVDGYGNIYQGRYYDPTYAEVHRQDVVGGHAYGWNYGTTGIAALGNFTGSNGAPEAMLRAIGDIAAFKIHRYSVNPAGYFGEWPALVGHGDILSTSCPANIHQHLPNIRVFASNEYSHYHRVDHQDYAYVGQGKDNQPMTAIAIKAGETANLYIDVRNAGIDTWRKDGSFPIRLGTANPYDRSSPFTTNSWLSSGRPGSFSYRVTGYTANGSANLQVVDEIRPSQIARFTIPVKAPEAGGTYVEFFKPLVEHYAWFIRDFAMHFRLIVEPRNFAWHGVEQTVYTDDTKTTVASRTTTMNNLRAGQRYYVVVRAQNDGNQTWRNDGSNPIRLGTFRGADRPSAVCNPSLWKVSACHRAATLKEATVEPGQIGSFEFWIEMPYDTTNQTFLEYFNIVAEGLSWAPDQGMYWQFNVVGEQLEAQLKSLQAYQDDSLTQAKNLNQIEPNERFYVVMQLQNIGNVIWKQTGLRAVRLGTQNPHDRVSMFCDSTWLNASRCHRIASAQVAVNPNATATFGFWMRAPTVPGTYVEHSNLVAENFSWFKNASIPLVMIITSP